MKNEKWLYFRSVTDEANETASTLAPTSLCIPASSILAIRPSSDTTLSVQFTPVKTREVTSSSFDDAFDYVTLTCDQGKLFEVMEAIVHAINAGPHSDGFIVIGDDVVTTDSATAALEGLTVPAEYIHKNLTGVHAIATAVQDGSFGIHEYYEVVTPMTGDDDDVCASLQVKLPAQACILDAHLRAQTLATSDHGLVALEVHSAAVADDAASGGTEIVGEDVSGDKSSPDADLDISSNAVLNAVVSMGNLLPVNRSTDESFFHVTAKEDMSSMTGTPEVGVYIKWIGLPAVII